MIRYATTADIEALTELGRREHALSQWGWMPFDEASFRDTALAFMKTVGRTVLFSGGGYLAGMVQPAGFSRRMMAIEYAWYAADGHGLELLSRFERWARNMGASCLVAHNYTNDARLARVMNLRHGYTMLGQAMSKNLEA